jgi:hypothetical protein
MALERKQVARRVISLHQVAHKLLVLQLLACRRVVVGRALPLPLARRGGKPSAPVRVVVDGQPVLRVELRPKADVMLADDLGVRRRDFNMSIPAEPSLERLQTL